MRIPCEVPAKRMKDTDKAGNKYLRFIKIKKHTRNNALNSMKETVKQGSIFEEKVAKFFCDGKNAVPMLDIDDIEGHGSGSVNSVFSATGRAETAMASKRNKLKLAAFGTAVHGAAIGRISAVDHFFNVF